MTEEPKTDENKLDWSKRFVDRSLYFKWQSAIEVRPADKAKGQMIGERIFPDGTREFFTVK